MDIDTLSIFVKVVEVGSFSGAAQILKVPKATVSAKIANLEKKLAVSLLIRTGRSLAVTEFGQIYYLHCKAALSELQEAENKINASYSTPKGLFRITLPSGLASTVMPRIIHKYLELYPAVTFEYLVTNLRLDLITENIDLAIRAGNMLDSSLISRKFFNVEFILCGTRKYFDNYGEIHNLKDLNKHVFLMHGSIVKNKMEFTNSLTKIVFPIYEIPYKLLTEDFLAIKELILLGDGIGFLPKYLLNMDEKEKNNLLPIFTDYHLSNTGAYSFVYPAQNKVSIKVKTFIETALAFVD